MSTIDNLVLRFKNKPKDFSWKEAIRLLRHFGYEQVKSGKTSGSRVKFYNERKRSIISIHKPHNPEILKTYQIDIIMKKLGEDGAI